MSLTSRFYTQHPIVEKTGNYFATKIQAVNCSGSDCSGLVSGVQALSASLAHTLMAGDFKGSREHSCRVYTVDEGALHSKAVEAITPEIGYIALTLGTSAVFETSSRLEDLKNRGYKLIINYKPSAARTLEYLLSISDVISIDFDEWSFSTLSEITEKIHQCRKLSLAQNIRTIEALNAAKDLGFDLFQGPVIGSSLHAGWHKFPGCNLEVVRNLAELLRVGVSSDAIFLASIKDPALIFYLTLCPSFYSGQSNFHLQIGVESYSDIVMSIPRCLLQAWIDALSNLPFMEPNDDWCIEARFHAKFMQLAVQRRFPANKKLAESAFFLGLLHHYKSTLRVETDVIIRGTVFAQIIDSALNFGQGELAKLIKFSVLEYNRIKDLQWSCKTEKQSSIYAQIALEAYSWAIAHGWREQRTPKLRFPKKQG